MEKQQRGSPPKEEIKGAWALILGGSSGLGLATAKKLASHGYHILIIHRDRKSDLEDIKYHFQEITLSGVQLANYNIDAINATKRKETIQVIKEVFPPGEKIKVLVHSIAKGSLKPMFANDRNTLSTEDFQITLNAMALSLYDWVKALLAQDMFHKDTRIISFTSEGNTKTWSGYAAVSAAKVTLEALTRNIALEFAPLGIKANCIQAGLVETKAITMIPGYETLKRSALARNPNGRLTTAEDVANAAYLLTLEEAQWITGTVIKVDGGESLQ
ncbi:MAG: SDR family oxidoreductase [Bacteroidota bacterium]